MGERIGRKPRSRSRHGRPFFRLLIVVSGFALPASAHHSVAGYVDEITVLEGRLTSLEWINPHVRLTLETTTGEGRAETWSLHGNSLYNLGREGITRDLFTIGERVRVAGRASRRGDTDMLVTNLLFSDGREVLLWPNQDGRFSDNTIGGDDLLAAEGRDQGPDGNGIFRVWSVPKVSGRVVSHLPFRQEAIDARASWNMFDNFAIRCEPEGMPRIMINPHPFEFVDNGNSITLRTELYDIERTIHMDRTEPPEDAPSSPWGYSVGRWEGDVLVVRTNRINWPYFDNIGTPQSPNVEIVERFVLSEDERRLDYHITVSDPETFTEPATIEGWWEALGDEIPVYDCQTD